jgi:GAF domain-containing protein
VVTDNAQADPRWLNRALAEAEGFHASVAVPLLFGGHCYAALCVSRRSRGGFRPEETALLASLAGQAGSALENARLYEGLREKNQHLRELFEIARRASVSLTLSDVIPTLAKAAAGLVGHDGASIRLLDDSGAHLLAVAHHGLSEAFVNRGPVAATEGVAGRVLGAGQPVFIEDLESDMAYVHRGHALAEGIRSMALVPLRSRDHTIGVLATYARSSRRYHQTEMDLLAEFANVAAITIENARLYEQARSGPPV